VLDDLGLSANEGPTNFDRRHNLVISGQALVPKTTGMTVAWVARALSGTHFSVVDSTTDPDRNGTFAEPLPAGSYTSTTGRNPYTADVDGERNGATGRASSSSTCVWAIVSIRGAGARSTSSPTCST
jgi:hypothetical protein